MIAPLEIPGAWMWSAWQPDRGMAFNSYLFERDGGFVCVDPLPLDDASLDAIAAMGRIHTIVLTNRDHERATQALVARFDARVVAGEREAALFGVRVDATVKDGEHVFEGAVALDLPNGKTSGEIALYLPQAKAAVVGDALLGTPAGSLSLLPDEKLQDVQQFILTLRRLWALELRALLLCDGQPLFADADAAIGALLRRRGGPQIHRINVAEIEYSVTRPGKYANDDGEVGLLIGARQIGYRLARIAPGKAYCPLHWHVRCEEFFYVLEGNPTIRTLDGAIECRPGDFIAFPAGETGAHQVRNNGTMPCLVLLVGMEEAAVDLEACFYPDSDKFGIWTTHGRLRLVRATPEVNYYEGEE
ncbi:MAG TPA: cupin domain-containing protein [Candidatus Baltobacteraceae bacterium]|jgi:uncharacterized cupin superfamily protein|nr:cupin domain-containing protein [Candidatus Baltobacteraceae bacterium]